MSKEFILFNIITNGSQFRGFNKVAIFHQRSEIDNRVLNQLRIQDRWYGSLYLD